MSLHEVVLLGAGHAHLEVIRRADELREVGITTTVVSPGDLWYSGLASAVVGGRLPAERDRVDVAALCRRAGVRLVVARAVGLDPGARQVTLDDGRVLPYDTLSLNVGSELALGDLEVDPDAMDDGGVVGIKPIEAHRDVRALVVAGLARGDVRVTIVGGGASAVEYAANVALLRPRRGDGRPRVTVLSGDVDVVPPAPPGARDRLLELLAERSVAVVRGAMAERVRRGACDAIGPDGEAFTVEHDVCVLATGLQAARAVRDLGLGDERGMPTDAHLRHVDHDDVFGVGDAIRFGRHGLPKLGVYGVRQAPVLVDNLVARATGRPLRRYEPQDRALAIMDMGGGTAVAMRGSRWYEGRLALVLKRFLDTRWIRRYRA